MVGKDQVILKALFEHASLGIIICDNEGKMQMVNPFAERIFGFESGEMDLQDIEILLPAKIRTKHIGHRKNYMQNPSPRSMGAGMNLMAMRKDGSEFFVEVSLSYYEVNNHLYVVSFINDITENKKIKDKLQEQTEELEKKIDERTKELSQALIELSHSNDDLESEIQQRIESEKKVQESLEKEKELSELKSRFVSMASHEFRTPLGGILSSNSLIEKYIGLEKFDKTKKHTDTIRKSVKGLTSILNDFLSLDKLEQKKITPNAHLFNLPQFLRNFVREFQDIQATEYHEIETQFENDSFEVYQDSEMIKNILTNLLSNSVKYSPKDRPIIISASLSGKTFTLKVQDFGIGIPESEQKHLFERFFRAGNVTNIQGTGLGLSIVVKYLEYLNGHINFESAQDVGTTFKVILPKELIV
ncbi:ATP-binding protein [Bacteriovoracaceae bacterium]|nr:ATP-binding protein [Bacteriovoracaceae bacterium]